MKLGEVTNQITRNVTHIDRLMGALEAVLLAVVGRIASWCASIPCAVMTFRSNQEIFGLSWQLSAIVAVSLELVGQSSSSQWMDAKTWNKYKKRKSDPEAEEGLAKGMMIAYFVIDFVIIGALAISDTIRLQDWRQLIAILYPVVTVISTIVLNQRIAQFRLESAIEQEKADRAETRKQKRKPSGKPEITPPLAEYDTKELALSVLRSKPDISGAALGRAVGVSERQGRNLKAELLPHKGNGHK